MTTSKYTSNITGAAVLAILAGLMWAVSPMMAWLKLGLIQADGFQKLGDFAYAYMGIGVLTIGAGAMTLANKADQGIVASGLLAIAGVVGHYALAYEHLVYQVESIHIGSPSVGIGAHMPFVAGALSLFSVIGVALAGKKPKEVVTATAPAPRERLARLDELRSDGAITIKEFEERRAQILQEL